MIDVRSEVRRRWRAAVRGLRTAVHAVGVTFAPMGRRAPEIVVSVGIVLSVLAALVLVGAARNDARIASDGATAVAEVLDGSSAQRTFVRFTASDGAVLTPEDGVFYPRGLEPGNLVLVDYSVSEPDLVKVSGRTWTMGLVPVALGVVGLWVVLAPLAWWLARRRRARRAAATGAGGPDGPAPTVTDREPVAAGVR